MCQVQQFLKIIMIFNNNPIDFLPYLLHLCALYCKTAVYHFILLVRSNSALLEKHV